MMFLLVVMLQIITIPILFFLFRNKDAFSVAVTENTYRVRLMFIVFTYLPLLFLVTAYFIDHKGVPLFVFIVRNITESRGELKILLILYQISLLGAIFTIPVTSLYHRFFGYRRFLDFIKKQDDQPKSKEISHLVDILAKTKATAGINAEIKLILIRDKIGKSIPGFCGCAIVGKGENDLNMLVSEDLLNLFRKGILTDTEIEAVFLHELSHVLHGDHFLPLWIRSIVPSNSLFIVVVCVAFAVFIDAYVRGWLQTDFIRFVLIVCGVALVWIIVVNMASYMIRQREHLADVRVAISFNRGTELIEAIKKLHLYIIPTSHISRMPQFTGRFALYDKADHIGSIHNLKDLFLFIRNIRQKMVDFPAKSIYWHSRTSKRISIIKDKSYTMTGQSGLLAPFSLLSLCFLMAACSFFISSAIVYFVKGTAFFYFGFTFALSAGMVLVFISCFPLKFAEFGIFKNAYIPPSWKQIPKLFLPSGFWGNMFINNILITITCTVCLWNNGIVFGYNALVALFLMYTITSVTIVSLMFIIKGRSK